ncbi:unnamed protein product [Sphenostylis stenocarpa]|uniref:Uncharacterized protein n=1 Tax=Sphenostylis stenocarpa TaxID=92480 RepID=A0AA86SBN6_9FABA|nr:unnamed protein product [Sphenostylis stenocarpa]
MDLGDRKFGRGRQNDFILYQILFGLTLASLASFGLTFCKVGTKRWLQREELGAVAGCKASYLPKMQLPEHVNLQLKCTAEMSTVVGWKQCFQSMGIQEKGPVQILSWEVFIV